MSNKKENKQQNTQTNSLGFVPGFSADFVYVFSSSPHKTCAEDRKHVPLSHLEWPETNTWITFPAQPQNNRTKMFVLWVFFSFFWPVKAIVEKRAATVEIYAFISPDLGTRKSTLASLLRTLRVMDVHDKNVCAKKFVFICPRC